MGSSTFYWPKPAVWLCLNSKGIKSIPTLCLKERRKNVVTNENYYLIDKVDKGNWNKLLKCQSTCLKRMTRAFYTHHCPKIHMKLHHTKLSVSIFISLLLISVILSVFPCSHSFEKKPNFETCLPHYHTLKSRFKFGNNIADSEF